MKTALPLFEDMPVVSSTLRVSGKSVERVGSLDVGEEVFLIVRAYVSGVNHETTDIGLERRHSLKAEELVIMPREDGARFLDEAHAMSDDRFGLQHLFASSGIDPDTGEISTP